MTREERAQRHLEAQMPEDTFVPTRAQIIAACLAFANGEAAAMRERAANTAATCEIKAVLTPGFVDGASSAATQIAAAIRALPATGEVGRG